MFEDGETFCRDNSKHTVCNACWEKEHEKKTAGKPDVQSDIQELDQVSLGKCFACTKDIFLKATTVRDRKYHRGSSSSSRLFFIFLVECFKCLKCSKVINPSDGYAQEGDGALCENCC